MEEVKRRSRDSKGAMYAHDRGADRQNFRDISEAMPEISQFNQGNNNDEMTGSTATNTVSYRGEYISMPIIHSKSDLTEESKIDA